MGESEIALDGVSPTTIVIVMPEIADPTERGGVARFNVDGADVVIVCPVKHNKEETILCGSRLRARQEAAVDVLQARSPSATRRTENSLIAFWHDRSAFNVWAMDIANVSVGGSNRSRWTGKSNST